MTAPSAEDIERQASEWIERRDFGPWTEADARELEDWIGQSLDHRVAFLRLDLEWKRTERLAALRPFRPHPAEAPAAGKWRRALNIAAAIAILGTAGGFGASYVFTQSGKSYSTPLGGRKVLTLADGSQIELNTNTVLHIAIDEHRRSATLERGEAYFSIKHDASRPFVVTAANHKVVDLGTKFLMRTSGNKLEVALVEGSAKVESSGEGQAHRTVTLKPGDIAYALPGSVSVVRKTPADIGSDLGWRRGVLVFRHATLADAAEEFNRYNAQKVVIADPETARLTFSATLPTHDTHTFVRILSKLFNTHSQTTTEGIVISR
jgi:transmembrane sensor